MIGHNYEITQSNGGKTVTQCIPCIFNNLPRVVYLHFTIDNLTKQTFTIFGAQRDKIAALLGVIVALETNRLSMVVRAIFYVMHSEYILPGS